MADKGRKRSRSSRGSSSVAVGIISFLLGFLFAFIVLFGSIFGVGYVAATTDINKIFELFGLENKNADYDESDPDSNKYNYINADQAPNIYTLVTEIINMANEGLGEINLNKIDALAPVTETVLNFAYGFIDDVVDFDKEYFQDVSLTSIIDSVTNSLYYVRTSKLVEMLNTKMGYSVDLSEIPIVSYLIDGVESSYATVKGMDESFKLPVLFDYYVDDGSAIGYGRTVADPNGISAYPSNFGGDTSFIHETTLKNSDGNQLYKVYYVPCKVTATGIEEAEYIVKKNVQEDPNVTFSKDGNTVKLKYVFRTVEFGEDTDFIAVKSNVVNGVETFELDYQAIVDAKNPSSSATASDRYLGYSYYESYARNYYDGPNKRDENDSMFGVSTVNYINYFKDNAGNVIEYDPLLISDIMLDALNPLNNVPVASVVNASQAEMVKGIFGDTSLGDILSQNVNFNELVNDIYISTFIKDVRADDKVMPFIVYNLTGIKQDGSGNYTAIYDKDGENVVANLVVEDGIIKSVTNSVTGDKIKGNNVADLKTLTNGLTLDVFIDVKADDAIMAYLGFGITDVEKVVGQDYSHIGKIGSKTVYIYTDDGGIITKVIDENGFEVGGTKVDEVSDRVNTIMDVLSLPDFIQVDPTDAIMAYLGYGVYDVVESHGVNNGKEYSHVGLYMHNGTEVTVYISTELDEGDLVVTGVWHGDGSVSGTKINNVSERLDNITNAIAITEFIDIDPDDAIMAFMGYGISGCQAVAGTDALGNDYDYKATYKTAGGTNLECYLTVNGEGAIDKVWYIKESATVNITGTKIGAVPDRISALTDTLTIGEIITVDGDASMILQAIKDTTIGGLDERINELTVSDVLTQDQIENNSILPQLKDTKITQLGTEIDKVVIQRIYAENIYGVAANSDPALATTFNSAYLYYELVDGSYVLTEKNCAGKTDTEYDNALGKLTEEQFNAGTYYSYGEAKGMWKLILYRVEGNTKTEKAYTLNNFNNMVNSCAESVYNSTLGELKEAKIIGEDIELNKKLRVVEVEGMTPTVKYVSVDSSGTLIKVDSAEDAKALSEFTLKQLLKAITELLAL
ncbi:MAG: hypothetical protein ACI4MB_05210 [Candidatus Coproplasma sp.]